MDAAGPSHPRDPTAYVRAHMRVIARRAAARTAAWIVGAAAAGVVLTLLFLWSPPIVRGALLVGGGAAALAFARGSLRDAAHYRDLARRAQLDPLVLWEEHEDLHPPELSAGLLTALGAGSAALGVALVGAGLILLAAPAVGVGLPQR